MRNKNFQEENIDIKGMTCKSCVDLIESEVRSLKGIKDIKVDLIKNNAFVTFNPKKISLEDIESKIASLGYSTNNMKGVKTKKNLLQGLMYGLIPHIGCIIFIIASIVGSTVAMQFFKPLLMNRYIFYILILISVVFATISSGIYLRKNNLLSLAGIRRKWKYLSAMYGSTVGINALLFFLIFPLLANVGTSVTGFAVVPGGDLASIKLSVDIPCPGHAPLISNELKTIDGVKGTQFNFPNNFDVVYDSTQTSKQEILSLEVFETYKPTVLDESNTATQETVQQYNSQPKRTGGCGCGSSSCGGGSGSCCGG